MKESNLLSEAGIAILRGTPNFDLHPVLCVRAGVIMVLPSKMIHPPDRIVMNMTAEILRKGPTLGQWNQIESALLILNKKGLIT